MKDRILSARPYLFPDGVPNTLLSDISGAYFDACGLRPYTSASSLNIAGQFPQQSPAYCTPS